MGTRYIKSTNYFLITFEHQDRKGRIIRLVAAENYGLACEKIQEVEKNATKFKNLTIGDVEGLKFK